ncbi:hypothetical protein [Nocardia sp. XZ_19_385]|uniref:hypothetical protein n=1 Tax=Nocardia sp. XZ_19_385 TaxID=2769488 RepID=UPI00188F44D8|nr:hypothetical protein [Nocardia sp. XZ_19_385]
MSKLRNTASVAFAIAAAGLALAAPQASAEIGTSVIIAGGGLSNGYGTGCTYSVIANSNSTARLDVADNGVLIGSSEGSSSPKTHNVKWTPATPGTHTLLVTQGADSKNIVLTVGTGINGGSSCLVI